MGEAHGYYPRKIQNQRISPLQRRAARPGDLKKRMHQALKVLLSVSFLGAVSLLVHYVGNSVYHSTYLALKEVRFEGCVHSRPEELQEIAEIRPGLNLLTLNLEKAADRMKTNGWVKEVRIERSLPGALKVMVKERVPVALVSHDGLFLVDGEGIPFKRAEARDNLDFPIITGLSLPDPCTRQIQEVFALLDTIEQRGVIAREMISEIHVDTAQGITLYTLNDAAPIRLGKGDYDTKIDLLVKVQEDLVRRNAVAGLIELVSPEEVHVKVAASS
jgi:cell division septal protein FtsQ